MIDPKLIRQAYESGEIVDSGVLEIRTGPRPATPYEPPPLSIECQMSPFPTIETPDPIKVLRLTRRQVQVWKLLDQGYVAELRRSHTKRPSKTYYMRAPGSLAADGAVVTARTIDPLVEQGWAVRVKMPFGTTWVFSQMRYSGTPLHAHLTHGTDVFNLTTVNTIPID